MPHRNDMTDARALRTLMAAYSSGEPERNLKGIGSAEIAYAVEAGIMFYPVTIDHRSLVASILDVRTRVSAEHVADLFLSSMSSRRLERRSALGSYAVAMHFPMHEFHTDSFSCDVCATLVNGPTELDLNQFNFLRYKWGSGWAMPEFVNFDLQQAAILEGQSPNKEDLNIFRDVISILESMPAEARPRDAERALGSVTRSNVEERQALLKTLGLAGIVQCPEHPGFFSHFIRKWDREPPPVAKINWEYPVSWWRGRCGINRAALDYFFGRHL